LSDEIVLALSLSVIGNPVQILLGSLDAGVPQVVLQILEWQSSRQLMGGIGMTQRMNATDLLDAGLAFGTLKYLLARRYTQRPVRPAMLYEKPVVGAVALPVLTQ
jgi:hypothetical protein